MCPLTFNTDVTLAQVKESVFVPSWLFHLPLETNQAIYIVHTLCLLKNVFNVLNDCYVHTHQCRVLSGLLEAQLSGRKGRVVGAITGVSAFTVRDSGITGRIV